MISKISLLVIFFIFFSGLTRSQPTSDLLKKSDSNSGQLNIEQDKAIDSLISRYILKTKKRADEKGYYGMDGYRIQIYRSSNRNAREESDKVRMEFISKFPDIISYKLYSEPGWFMIRVGDYRTKTEAIKWFLKISKDFPDAYLVPDYINFPDLIKK